ncbi:MAG: tellurium resistance protein TerC [Algicola sp.]|nr:tellurium resistance protein TerC [Algicola sp.]
MFKKSAITVVAVFILFLGLIFIILPGPAIILIPVGLALLSLEYPQARKWLVKFQRFMSVSAAKMDKMMRDRRR